MTNTNQEELAASRAHASSWVARPLHLEDVEEDMDYVRERLSSGGAFLKVLAYPWGVEFDVCEAGEQA